MGYAYYNKTLTLNGNISVKKPGIIEITSATFLGSESSNLASGNTDPNFDKMHIDFTVKAASSAKTFTATYLITVENNSFYDYTYVDLPISATISGKEDVPKMTTTITEYQTGKVISSGEVIEKETSLTVKLKIVFETNDAGETIIVNGGVTSSVDNSGSLLAAVSPKTGDLRGEGTLAKFTVNVANTFKYHRSITFTSSNQNFIIVNSNGEPFNTFSINANETKDFDIYLKVKEGSIFLSEKAASHIIVSSSGVNNIDTGALSLDVDVDLTATDVDKPEVGNVNVVIPETDTTDGSAIVSWNRIDSGGSSIINYHVSLTSDAGNTTEYDTHSAITSLVANNLSPGVYYATVYGEDEAGNTGRDDCGSASTGNGYCSKSESTTLKWIYNITYDLTNLTQDGASTAMIYSSYESTLSVSGSNNRNTLPNTITVKMGNKTLSSGTDYSYNGSTGKIIINKITDDVTISATASSWCLVKGTKIKLANGEYKNIEDIAYDDLLMVYDHETGKVTYEYPIWIESEKKTNSYQQTTFSDGSILKTSGPHGVYSLDSSEYVSVLDEEKFHVGTRIYKINENNEREVITVSRIEIIYEDTSYYHVSSTRFHNIIANDILTTDGTLVTSNMFSFNEDATWSKEREEFLATNDLFDYHLYSDMFPEFIFFGYRMAEAKNIYNKGLLSIKFYSDVLRFDNMKLPIMNDQNKRMWMVTTSDDVVVDKSNYLVEEGSYYTLKEPSNKEGFIGWKNLSDSKVYQPNDQVRVIYGIHFVALYDK